MANDTMVRSLCGGLQGADQNVGTALPAYIQIRVNLDRLSRQIEILTQISFVPFFDKSTTIDIERTSNMAMGRACLLLA